MHRYVVVAPPPDPSWDGYQNLERRPCTRRRRLGLFPRGAGQARAWSDGSWIVVARDGGRGRW